MREVAKSTNTEASEATREAKEVADALRDKAKPVMAELRNKKNMILNEYLHRAGLENSTDFLEANATAESIGEDGYQPPSPIARHRHTTGYCEDRLANGTLRSDKRVPCHALDPDYVKDSEPPAPPPAPPPYDAAAPPPVPLKDLEKEFGDEHNASGVKFGTAD